MLLVEALSFMSAGNKPVRILMVHEFFTDDAQIINMAQNSRSTNRFIRMVGDVRRKGGKPILWTAVMRRKFDAGGHSTGIFSMNITL